MFEIKTSKSKLVARVPCGDWALKSIVWWLLLIVVSSSVWLVGRSLITRLRVVVRLIGLLLLTILIVLIRVLLVGLLLTVLSVLIWSLDRLNWLHHHWRYDNGLGLKSNWVWLRIVWWSWYCLRLALVLIEDGVVSFHAVFSLSLVYFLRLLSSLLLCWCCSTDLDNSYDQHQDIKSKESPVGILDIAHMISWVLEVLLDL
jgi:hypothetical protein